MSSEIFKDNIKYYIKRQIASVHNCLSALKVQKKVRLIITFPFSGLNRFSYISLNRLAPGFAFTVIVKVKVLTALLQIPYPFYLIQTMVRISLNKCFIDCCKCFSRCLNATTCFEKYEVRQPFKVGK